MLCELESFRVRKPVEIASLVQLEELLPSSETTPLNQFFFLPIHVLNPSKVLLRGAKESEECLHCIVSGKIPKFGAVTTKIRQDIGLAHNEEKFCSIVFFLAHNVDRLAGIIRPITRHQNNYMPIDRMVLECEVVEDPLSPQRCELIMEDYQSSLRAVIL
jgi:hypothetical protein